MEGFEEREIQCGGLVQGGDVSQRDGTRDDARESVRGAAFV
jgi:hypothetical protein